MQVSYSHWRGGPPEWTDEDRAKATAYERWLASHCPRCGTREDDWQEDDGSIRREPEWEPVVRGCHGCEQKARLEEHIPDAARRTGAHVAFVASVDFDPRAEVERLDSVGSHRPTP